VNLALHPVLTALIALGPAAIAYWRGRHLLADLDDPALPERLLAVHRRNAHVFGISIGVLIATSPGRLVWALPLLVLARMLAAYPLRKRLYSETWSAWAYLSFYIRLLIAATGFWMFLGAVPAIAASAGTRDWIVAIALGAIALVWNAQYVRMFRALVGADPVDAPAIRSRFAQLATECGVPEVTLHQVRLRGGSFTNAVALPSTHAPAVVVTDTLLERFDEDEVTAILAHELAHHEHFKPRLRQATFAVWLVIAVAVLLPTMVRLVALPGIVFVMWPVAIAVALMLRLQQMQQHETPSDLRAVALTRDPEALVRALTKLHVLARIPRRWDAEFERRATHPSLARRVQAIRRASGAESPSLAEPATFVDGDGSASVTFHGDRLEWREAASMTHAIHYQSLRELRIDVRSSPAPELIAVDLKARRWTIPLHTGDIARVQEVLDCIDGHLGKSDAPEFWLMSGTRLVTLVVIVFGMAVGQMAVLFAGVLALIQPASQVAAAAGVSALAAAVFAWRDRTLWELSEFSGWLPLTLGLAGAALIAIAVANRRETPRGAAPRKIVAALAVSAGLGWVIVALLGVAAIDLHRNAREWPSVAILTCACAGALAFERSRKIRWGSFALALGGAVAAYAGSTDFVDRFVTDPFVAPASSVDVQTQTTSPVSELSVDFYPSSLWLSAAGEYVALASENAREQSTIHAGRAGGSLAAFPADDAAFLSESELLLLERQSRESVLRLVDLADNREVWTLRVPVRWADLSIDRSTRRWRLLGHNADADIVSAEGHIGQPDIRQSQWKAPDGIDHVEPLAMSGGTVIALETRHAGTAGLMGLLPWPASWSLGRAESSLWRLSDRGAAVFAVSNAELSCHSSPSFDKPSACAAFDGSRTRFFTLDAERHALTPQTSIFGEVYVSGMDDRGWLSLWWDGTAVALHPTRRVAIRFGEEAGDRAYRVAVGRSVVAGIFSEGGTSTIRIHPVEPDRPSDP
jgi:Zn-dependent protease with chaperone function